MTSMEARPRGLSREVLIDAILEFLADQDPLTVRDILAALECEIDRAGPDALLALKARLVTDNGWDYYPRDPLAQRIHHLLADRFLGHGSELRNAHHLARVTQRARRHRREPSVVRRRECHRGAAATGRRRRVGEPADRLGGPESLHES